VEKKEMVDKEMEETIVQDSPTVEPNEPEQTEPETAEKPEETPEEEVGVSDQDRNWKALREENEALKSKLKETEVKDSGPSPLESMGRSVDNIYHSPEETAIFSKEELRAELKFPELEDKNLFSMAVIGEYRSALDTYNMAKINGRQMPIPSVYKIAQRVKGEIDTAYGSVSKKALEEGAKKAKEATAEKEATYETESRSDRSSVARRTAELSELQQRSRRGDFNAVAERLTRSGL